MGLIKLEQLLLSVPSKKRGQRVRIPTSWEESVRQNLWLGSDSNAINIHRSAIDRQDDGKPRHSVVEYADRTPRE